MLNKLVDNPTPEDYDEPMTRRRSGSGTEYLLPEKPRIAINSTVAASTRFNIQVGS
ncbi:hypothetical protein O9992_28555 [Vibrio lentus]|nr:hypothetical protein [Vibrio lentus]